MMMGVWVFIGTGIAALSWMSRWLYLRNRKSKPPELPPTENTSIVVGNDTQANSPTIEAGAAASTPVVVKSNNMPDTVFASQTDAPVRRSTNHTPLEIRKAQEALPELQQEDFLKTFSGMKVSWPLVVVSVFKLEEEFCTLVLIAVDELLVLDWIGASLHEASILTSL